MDLMHANHDENVFTYIRNKPNLTASELLLYFNVITKHLIRIENNKHNNILNYFDSLQNIEDIFNKNSLEDLKLLHEEHEIIKNDYHKCNNTIKLDRENLMTDINLAFKHLHLNDTVKNTMSIIENQQTTDVDMVCCEYKEFCRLCKDTYVDDHLDNKYDYCYSCYICNCLRSDKEKYEKKRLTKMLNKKLDEKYNVIDNKTIITKPNKHKLKLKNELVNNTYIQININQNYLTQPYVETKDKYFEVYVTSNKKDIEQLKHVFIYLMCRSKAIKLFPDDQHNSSTTYPLSAGLYTINKEIVLHGLLRYKNVNSSRITMIKLQNITTKTGINIQVNELKLVNDVKYHYCINKLSSVINKITSSDSYGSAIDDFFKPDKLQII